VAIRSLGRRFRFNWGRRAWDGMQVRGELRMGRGGDKISRKTILGLITGKKSLGWYAGARRVEDGTRWR
jgi:hypothetical protein